MKIKTCQNEKNIIFEGDKYMENVVLHVAIVQWLNLKKIQVKYSSYIKYKKVIQLHIEPSFGECRASDINELMIYQFFMNKKKEVSSSMLQTIRYLLKAILTYAQSEYAFPNIEFDHIRLPVNKIKQKCLTKEEEVKLCGYCTENNTSLSLSILFGLYAGMRIGEICGLRWKDIDLKKDIIQVHYTVQRLENEKINEHRTSLYILEPKSQSSEREIPLVPFLKNYLIHYQQMIKCDENTFIISCKKRPMDPRTLQYQYKQLCKKLEIQDSFHSLRHRFATSCIEHQVDVKSLSEILGHADVVTTLKRYVHSSMEYKKEQLSKLKVPHFS